MNLKIFISKNALERIKKDKFVRENLKWYNQHILMIAQNPNRVPHEKIGKFYINPRGHENRRIAYHFEFVEKDRLWIIYIDDLLYHEKTGYVDSWNVKAKMGEIKNLEFKKFNELI